MLFDKLRFTLGVDHIRLMRENSRKSMFLMTISHTFMED